LGTHKKSRPHGRQFSIRSDELHLGRVLVDLHRASRDYAPTPSLSERSAVAKNPYPEIAGRLARDAVERELRLPTFQSEHAQVASQMNRELDPFVLALVLLIRIEACRLAGNLPK
jgi:hypothetical protein